MLSLFTRSHCIFPLQIHQNQYITSNDSLQLNIKWMRKKNAPTMAKLNEYLYHKKQDSKQQ